MIPGKQDFKINLNIIYQDNTSSMKLLKNGKEVQEKEQDTSISNIFMQLISLDMMKSQSNTVQAMK